MQGLKVSNFKLAQIQMPSFAKKQDTKKYLEQKFEQIKSENLDFVCLPEMFYCPYALQNFAVYAEADAGDMWQFCSNLAKKYNLYLSAGSCPEAYEDKIYNTAYVFNRQGEQIAKHRKMHLFDINIKNGQYFMESEVLSAGNEITTFDTEFGTFGLCICFDFRFPELGRLMALNGAKLIIVPAAFNMTTGPSHWEIMFRSQSINNQVFTVGTAPARDIDASYVSYANSLVVDAFGTVISRLDEKEAVSYTTINLSNIDSLREQLPLLKNRRTDIYNLKRI